MDKKKRTLMIGGAVLLVLVGLLVLLLVTGGEKDGAESSEQSSSDVETFRLIDEEDAVLKSLDISNSDDQHVIEHVGESKWDIAGLEQYSTNSELATGNASRFQTLDASARILEKVENKAEYGLEEPYAKAVLSFDNGNTYTLSLGDPTPDGTGYYLMKEGDDALYTVSNLAGNVLTGTKFNYLSTSLIEAYTNEGEEETQPSIESFSISRKDLEHDYLMESFEKDDSDVTAAYTSGLRYTQPVVCDLDAGRADDALVYSLFGLSAQSAVDIDVAANGGKYGLDDPFATFVLKYDGRTATMVFGNPANEEATEYYMTFNDNDVVYTVSTASVAALTVDPNTVVSRLGILPGINNVDTMTLNIRGQDYQFTLKGDDEAEEEDAEPLSVWYEGRELDIKNFRQFYQLLLYPNLESVNFEQPEGNADITLEFNYLNQAGSSFIEMFDTGRKMIYAIDGNAARSGRSAYMPKVEKELNNLLAGNEVQTDW